MFEYQNKYKLATVKKTPLSTVKENCHICLWYDNQ